MGRILVADDHDSLRRGIVRALSDARHDVDEAPNGNVAIEKLHEGQYDVVLSDLKMGGSDGMDVLRTAKALHPTSAVILMTAFGSVHTAVEAMNGTGTIEITALALDGEEESSTAEQTPGPMVMITITDTGPGIPPEVVDRIFSPFFTTKPQGSGLGLAIVRKIVDAHDGRIDVGQRPGGGTVFRVTLPVRSQQPLFE